MAQLNSACSAGGGLPAMLTPLSGVGGKIDLRLLLSNGSARIPFLRARFGLGSGDSLGVGFGNACHVKGFSFNARKNVQRPCVERLGGPVGSFAIRVAPSVDRSSLNTINHEEHAECLRKNTEILSNRELSK